MWGALAGFGQGLQDYSNILGEKQRQDMALKRDEVQYQRQVALEELRASNQMAAAETQRGWDQEDWNRNKAYEQEKTADTRQYKEGQTLKEAEIKFDQFKQMAQFTAGMEEEKRMTTAARFKESALKDGVWDATDEATFTSISSGIPLDLLMTGSKDRRVSAAEMEQVNKYLESDETFINMKDPSERMAYVQTVYKSMFPQGNDNTGRGVEIRPEIVQQNREQGFTDMLNVLKSMPPQEAMIKIQEMKPHEQEQVLAALGWENQGSMGTSIGASGASAAPKAGVARTPEGYPVTGKSITESLGAVGNKVKGVLSSLEERPYPER